MEQNKNQKASEYWLAPIARILGCLTIIIFVLKFLLGV